MPTWAYAVLGFVAWVVAGTVWIRVRTRRIAASRPGENFDTFHSSFAADDIPAEILQVVYAECQEWCSDAVAAFPVRAADNISRIYGLVDEDLEYAVLDVVQELDRQLPPAEASQSAAGRHCARLRVVCGGVSQERRHVAEVMRLLTR